MKIVLNVTIVLTVMGLLVCTSVKTDASSCKLADEVAREAAKEMGQNKSNGLKLFIKAQSLCPSGAIHNYNLALAYYQYGVPEKAEEFARNALSLDSGNLRYKNALAWMMLNNGSDLILARKYAEECVRGESGSSAYSDTLIWAYQKNDMLLEAYETALKALKKWPSEKKLKQRYEQVEDACLEYYFVLGKQGKTSEALKGLERLKQSPKAAEGRCWLLYWSGKIVEALQLAKSTASQFGSQYSPLQLAFDEIMDVYVQARYEQFQEGDRAGAITAVDEMKKHFPDNNDLETAHDVMFDAVLADVTTIQVPELKPVVTDSVSRQSDDMLAELRESGTTTGEVSLLADVDKNIPCGGDKRPHAVAVVIGNKRYSQYGNNIPDVRFADRDAAFIRKYLIETFGYDSANVIYKLDATQGDLLKIFGSQANPHGKLYHYVKSGKSDVFVFYSGHGAPDLEKGDAYIVPVDADVAYIANNGYGMDVFYNNLAKLPARSVIVVMDACFSGNSAGGMLVKNVSPALFQSTSPVRKMNKTVVFSSTGQGQVSHWYPQMGHGLFTYYFLKGIGGEADVNGNKRITVVEMKTYLADNIPYQALRMGNSEQTPVVVSGLGDDAEIVRLK